jgi:hypothetical protein
VPPLKKYLDLQIRVKKEVKFTTEEAMKAQMGSRSIALLFL